MIEPKQSYALVSSSDLLKHIVGNYIIELNRQHNIFVGANLYGISLVISDTAEPTARSIVLSKIARQNSKIKELNIDENIPELVFEMQNIDREANKDTFRLIKQKLKNTAPELKFYKVSAIVATEPITIESIENAINLKYKGVHTTTEQLDVLVEFIMNSNEINLQRVIKYFNEQDGGYQKLINCITLLTNDTPEWVANRYKQTIESANFIKALLKIALIVLKAPNRDEFIVAVLKDIIYK